MRVLSLFAGIGGFDLGFERAGMEVVAQCEADDECRQVLAARFPGVPIHHDVTELGAEWIGRQGLEGRVEVVCGGFPCQDLSYSGRRAGLGGERSSLFFDAARIADLVLGDGGWIVIENVPGLLTSNGGADFGIVLTTLADLGFCDFAYRVLDSRGFGVPQRRRRVFVIARRATGHRAREVLFEPDCGRDDPRTRGQAWEGAASTYGQGFAGPLGTLTGGFKFDLESHGAYVDGEDGVRRLTPTEWERLQGFPDGWTIPDRELGDTGAMAFNWQTGMDQVQYGPDSPTLQVGQVPAVQVVPLPRDPKPDGRRYAQVGNAVTVPVAEWLGRRMMEAGQ